MGGQRDQLAMTNMGGPSTVDLAALEAALAPLAPLQPVTLRLPRTGRVIRLLRPMDIDRLLDAAETDPEEQLPYWAELWPSGIALADAVLLNPERVCGQRVLELGCGLGVTAAATLLVGADLVVTDYAAEALALTRYTCAVNAKRLPACFQLNWRHPPASFFAFIGEGFPVVLAADVLYEARDVVPLLALVERLVLPGGLLWLAEPGRTTAAAFVAELHNRGWNDAVETWDGPWPDAGDAHVTVAVHALRRPVASR